MKSATRMALVTGEMSDCMSGAEPGRAAWGSASVRSSVCRLRRSPALLSAAPVATVEDGARGFVVRQHTHEEPGAHAHALRDANLCRRSGRATRGGLPLLVSRLSPDPLSLAHQRTETETGAITDALCSTTTTTTKRLHKHDEIQHVKPRGSTQQRRF